jgi:hypothetical protein
MAKGIHLKNIHVIFFVNHVILGNKQSCHCQTLVEKGQNVINCHMHLTLVTYVIKKHITHLWVTFMTIF